MVHKAKPVSAPEMNGISCNVYEKCPKMLELLAKLLDQVWQNSEMPTEWCRANGAYILKEENAEKLSQFRPIIYLCLCHGTFLDARQIARHCGKTLPTI